MTTILFTFIISFALSLVLTPVARWLGLRFGAIDEPGERKVHTRAIPRSGGVAIFLSFFLTIFACTLLMTKISDLIVWNDKRLFAVLGGLVVFSVGFYDDFHRLGPKIKFLIQIVAASLAFYGGLRIEAFAIGKILGIKFGVLSYFITVFWFLLFINAVNLIDGLDGLAAGVGFFTSIVMMFMSIVQVRPDYLIALEFAALGGALLGFLRYNFNPASIFLGDGGSYFIGYAIAALAIFGSIKSSVGATLLIPILALGVPIFDTILSPVRRFILGRRMFRPDKKHVHHHLLAMGLSSRKAVLVVYGITCVLSVLAILLVNYRSESVGMPLIIIAVGAFVFTRKLGYMEYIAFDKMYGWLQDLSDASGLTRHRRSFLNLQIDMERSRNIDELWENICQALVMLHFDRGELHVNGIGKDAGGVSASIDKAEKTGQSQPVERRQNNSRGTESITNISQLKMVTGEAYADVRIWSRGYYQRETDISTRHFLKIEIPLCNNGDICYASLILFKDARRGTFQPFTLRRVEHLRRSVTRAMEKLNGSACP